MNNDSNGCATLLASLILIGVLAYALWSFFDYMDDGKKTLESVNYSTTYTTVSISQLYKELSNNAASANEKYKEKFISVTGRLSVIDSDLSYISIEEDDSFLADSILCDILTEEQKTIVKTLTIGDIITVKGQVTDVDELFGYYLNITEILKY